MNVLFVLVLLASLFSNAYAAEEKAEFRTQFLTHNLKESVFTDFSGQVRGIEHAGRRAFNLELVRSMANGRNIVFKPVEVPFVRGVELVKGGPHYAIFNISRNSAREALFKWVGPLQSDTVQFFQNMQFQQQLNDYREFTTSVKVCVLRGSRHERILKAETSAVLVLTNSYNSCFRMLAEGRVDLTPVSLHEVDNVFRSSGVSDKTVIKSPIILYKSQGFIAFSQQTPDSEINLWQQILDQLKASGEYDRLKAKYLLPRQ